MKSLFILIILNLLYYLFQAAQIPFIDEFKKSLATWKKLNPCVYTYVSEFQSWTGYGQRAENKVANHKVVKRSFEAWEPYLTPESVNRIIESWVENSKQIGTHMSGYPAKTMEQLYKECQEEILTKNIEENEIFFTVDEKGILKECQYYPRLCADDCLFGISLSQVNFRARRLRR